MFNSHMIGSITKALNSVLLPSFQCPIPYCYQIMWIKALPNRMYDFLKSWFSRKNTSMLLLDDALITAISDVGQMDSIYIVLLSKCTQTAGSASWDTVQSWNRLETLNHRVPWTLLFREWQSDWLIIHVMSKTHLWLIKRLHNITKSVNKNHQYTWISQNYNHSWMRSVCCNAMCFRDPLESGMLVNAILTPPTQTPLQIFHLTCTCPCFVVAYRCKTCCLFWEVFCQ